LNLQKAANYQYLEAVIEHVGVALMCLDREGQMVMANGAARRLFGLAASGNLQSLGRVDARLPALLRGLGDGERTLFTVARDDGPMQLVLYATVFELLEQRYTLVSFQDIRSELDRQELDSWQKLIRVLTHEIMNSVTPITSLSRVVQETLFTADGGVPALRQLSASEQDDLFRSITAIQTRSSGLLDFVQAYRSFSTLPAPAFADVSVPHLFERVHTLMASQVAAAGIRVEWHCDEHLAMHADSRQLEQVLINLVRNAAEALADRRDGRIGLQARHDEDGRVEIQVIDNGPGVEPQHLDSIFVPFFTTRRNGTGVGLSISRQIVHANRGSIGVKSTPEGCMFTLKLMPGLGIAP
jgi:two-component system, NtrC family, nitrogen regulation sensor histidine kinase NtrY